jgi:glucosamine 6-phosphate synthetase-like amidotransferase/phosphosugar isomerase protein
MPCEAVTFWNSGLQRLSYRGDDGAEAVTIDAASRIEWLESRLAETPFNGRIGIVHTRWATHGAQTDGNAHPHPGNVESPAVVHNEVIENFAPQKQRRLNEGYVFRSATDTEVIAHQIGSCWKQRKSNGKSLPGEFILLMLDKIIFEQITGSKRGSGLPRDRVCQRTPLSESPARRINRQGDPILAWGQRIPRDGHKRAIKIADQGVRELASVSRTSM